MLDVVPAYLKIDRVNGVVDSQRLAQVPSSVGADSIVLQRDGLSCAFVSARKSSSVARLLPPALAVKVAAKAVFFARLLLSQPMLR